MANFIGVSYDLKYIYLDDRFSRFSLPFKEMHRRSEHHRLLRFKHCMLRNFFICCYLMGGSLLGPVFRLFFSISWVMVMGIWYSSGHFEAHDMTKIFCYHELFLECCLQFWIKICNKCAGGLNFCMLMWNFNDNASFLKAT